MMSSSLVTSMLLHCQREAPTCSSASEPLVRSTVSPPCILSLLFSPHFVGVHAFICGRGLGGKDNESEMGVEVEISQRSPNSRVGNCAAVQVNGRFPFLSEHWNPDHFAWLADTSAEIITSPLAPARVREDISQPVAS